MGSCRNLSWPLCLYLPFRQFSSFSGFEAIRYMRMINRGIVPSEAGNTRCSLTARSTWKKKKIVEKFMQNVPVQGHFHITPFHSSRRETFMIKNIVNRSTAVLNQVARLPWKMLSVTSRFMVNMENGTIRLIQNRHARDQKVNQKGCGTLEVRVYTFMIFYCYYYWIIKQYSK